MTSALLATADPLLHDELVRLAAAAGCAVVAATDPGGVLREWTRAPAVLVGSDLLAALARLAPPRRPGVYAVGWGAAGEELFRHALAVGAESVLELPAAGGAVSAVLTDLEEDGHADGAVLAVVGGAGGAGATVLTAATAQAAARRGAVLAVDTDPAGPGLDRVLGMEESPGVRWEDLGDTAGRLGARALRDALPRSGRLAVLSWSGDGLAAPSGPVLRSVLSAGRRGHDLVIVDLPRTGGEVVEEVLGRCDLAVIIVPATVAGVASSRRLLERLGRPDRLMAVVRGAAVDPESVGRALGVPVLASMADQRGLVEAIDLGLGPVRSWRGPLGRTAAQVVSRSLVA